MTAAQTKQTILDVDTLRLYFPIRAGVFNKTVGNVKAVNDISFRVQKNTTLGLVGESGCGKTTAGRAILRLLEPTGGTVKFNTNLLSSKGTTEPVDVGAATKSQMRRLRREMQIIFQDPFSSLEPRMTIRRILREPLMAQGITNRRETDDRIEEIMGLVGLQSDQLARFPHEFSGGQRQRIGIAKALILNPTFIIADEAVSALDVSIQAQILNLLQDLQEQKNLTYLFISHDLGVVRHVSDRIAVMYLGRIVELADKETLFSNPRHPYSEALISAVPKTGASQKWVRVPLKGEVASATNVPSGCAFHPRCRFATNLCRETTPALRKVAQGQLAACHFSENLDLDPLGRRTVPV